MKITVFQSITIIFLIAFVIYELFYIPQWLDTLSDDEPPIRTDLIIFPAILLILIIISLIQFIIKRK